MKELSVFVDESGNYGGENAKHYLITLVFHRQSISIQQDIARYEQVLRDRNLPNIPLHMNPLMRGNDAYRNMPIQTRMRLLTCFSTFALKCPIEYFTFAYQRNQFSTDAAMFSKMQQDLVAFLSERLNVFQAFDAIKLYYDNGQEAVRATLHMAFEHALGTQVVIYRNCSPKDFRLQQVADYICELELAAIKYEKSEQGNAEKIFFGTYRDFKKNHLRRIRKKRIQ